MSKNNPKVSIILPTYNGYKYITTSIVSCLSQTYQNIELIIVDDGSSSKTKKIIHSFRDKRIKIITLKKNRGLSYALNKGFLHASGDYLTWTSDDNYYKEEAIEKMLDYLHKNKAYFIFCDYYHFKDTGEKPILVKLRNKPNLTRENGIGACFLYGRKVKEVIGNYDENLPLVEDYDYWLRVSKKFKLFHLNKPLYYFRRHKDSLTSKYSQSSELKTAIKLLQRKNNIGSQNKITKMILDSISKLFF